jgi:transposase InsO family protein
LVLVEVSVVEQRYQAVLAVQSGVPVVEVADRFGVSRQSVHNWLTAYRDGGLAGLDSRSRRPSSSPWQAEPVVEAAVCEMRREHPRWGPARIAFELGRDGCPGKPPSRMTVYRILIRHGLVTPKTRKRRREDYLRWERPEPMQLWQMDIVGGVWLTSGIEAKVVTAVDDHSRFCVSAKVVLRATGRAVCLAFAEAMTRHGVPEELLSDNGKQFTDRFGKGGEVLFDRICRDNGITHRLTPPRTPTVTGKVERFHGSLRRELLDHCGPFENIAAAQVVIDAWVVDYNTRRPHQALGMASPADRFHTPAAALRTAETEQLLPLKLPASLERALAANTSDPDAGIVEPAREDTIVPGQRWAGEAIEFDRMVPASGNMSVAGKQFWLGPSRAGVVVTFWADTDVIHLLIAGVRVKSFRSHLSVADLAALYAQGGRNAGPSPIPAPVPGVEAVEVDRTVARNGTVSLGQHLVLAAEILAGRRVAIRVDQRTLMFFDPDTRDLLRIRPNPLNPDEISKLRAARPAGPAPQPSSDPVRVQRRASNSGVVMVVGQKIALGRAYKHQTVAIDVAEHDLVIHLESGPRVIARTTDLPVRWTKAHRPRKVESVV